jgi:two-component SAPR family response regulator
MIINPETRVLVVDDTPKQLQETANFARRIGYKVVDTVSNNIDALTNLRYQKYGLIISDNADLFKNTPDTQCNLVVLDSEYKLNTINSSVHKYIVKPFSEETLKHTIEEI